MAVPVDDHWIVATAPARVDLSGGWSDTPPVSYEYGGAVAGLAVTVDNLKPLSCRCRVVSNGQGILVCTESREGTSGALLGQQEFRLQKIGDLSDFRDPTANCTLIKCALICLGLVASDDVQQESNADTSLQPYINKFCGSNDHDLGLEIISASLLPVGSGMGTSSILGGCVLAAIGRCAGMDFTSNGSKDADSDGQLIHAVLTLEQLMTTGGGWQDQVGGLIGGLKLATSDRHTIPLRTGVERIPLSPCVKSALDDRLVLVFTGKPRLAKDILRNVLRRWARRSPEIVQTVQDLVAGAGCAADALRGENVNLDELGRHMKDYWKFKKIMAGEGSGAEPEEIRKLLVKLYEQKVISGGTICGAGGGGFLVLLLSDGQTMERAEQIGHDVSAEFTWHDCKICEDGLTVKVVRNDARGDPAVDSFDTAWHRVTA